MQHIRQVKHVKESIFIRQDDGTYECQHYGTTILKVVPSGLDNHSLRIETINRASVTSSRMINRCLEYLGYPKEYKKAKEQEIFIPN